MIPLSKTAQSVAKYELGPFGTVVVYGNAKKTKKELAYCTSRLQMIERQTQ